MIVTRDKDSRKRERPYNEGSSNVTRFGVRDVRDRQIDVTYTEKKKQNSAKRNRTRERKILVARNAY